MRIVEYLGDDGSAAVGVVRAEGISTVCSGTLHALLQQPDWFTTMNGHAGPVDVAIGEVTFRPLLGDTGRVFAAGLNYKKIYPAGDPPPTPKFPPWFWKMPGTLVGHNQPVIAPSVSETFDYEAELAAVIGHGGRHIAVEDALDHVAGWTCLNDGSVRAWQRHSVNAGKNFERSGSIGPWMVTADEFSGYGDMHIESRVNGEVRQTDTTASLMFDFAYLISYVSTIMTLKRGDIISTGTPEGVGYASGTYLKAGDVVETEVEGLGAQRNNVVAEIVD